MKKIEIGRIGEDKTVEYLKRLNFSILRLNYREKFGEIDIIAREADKTLVFIEVKTISLNEWTGLTPEDNFTTHKYIKVKRTCEFFVRKNPDLIDEDFGWRIDLVAVEISQNGKYAIRHYKNV
jgi:putative endonuclease